jgi:hypothetical protein
MEHSAAPHHRCRNTPPTASLATYARGVILGATRTRGAMAPAVAMEDSIAPRVTASARGDFNQVHCA